MEILFHYCMCCKANDARGSVIWCPAKITFVGETVIEMFQKGIIEHEGSGLMVKVASYTIEWTTGEKQQTMNRLQEDVRAPEKKKCGAKKQKTDKKTDKLE